MPKKNTAENATLAKQMLRAEIERDSLVIIIKDYGEGMDKETLENIFIPFYTKKSSGTGLGMALAKKIIEGHKGEIHMKSRKGSGTEVLIKLPRDEREGR